MNYNQAAFPIIQLPLKYVGYESLKKANKITFDETNTLTINKFC